MKFSDFWTAQRLISERSKLKTLLTSKLGVTLSGTYQDDTIVELVRPIVLAELRARIAVIDAELKALGVKIDV